MTITKKLLTPNSYSRPQTLRKATTGVVIHWVGNPGSTAIANRNYFDGLKDSKKTYASSHYIVGLDREIIQCVPENEIAYHATTANSTHIGIEVCHPDATGKFSDTTYSVLIDLIADICTRHKLDPLEGVLRHHDVSGKICPKYYVDNPQAWQRLKNDANNAILRTPIMCKPTATVEQMKTWAKSKGAKPFFIDLADTFFTASTAVGVNPVVTYCQSAKETAYGKFGGVLDESYCNPCGMKKTSGGGDYDRNAHMRFASWLDGISAQVDHLALYAGAAGYPKADTKDPRHFPAIDGTAKSVEALGGKWAPAVSYGSDIVKMMDELERTVDATPKPHELTTNTIILKMEQKISLDKQYWINVLNGVTPANPAFLKTVFARLLGIG